MAFSPRAQSSVAEITEQLQREEEWLRSVEENVEKSHQLREGMAGILDSFQQRLQFLDNTVNPLYQETHRLQTRQTNIAKALKSINTTIEHYSIANEMDTTIRDADPGQDLDKYLKLMEKLEKAIKFFGHNKEYESQLDSVGSLSPPTTDFLNVYAEIRSATVLRSLQAAEVTFSIQEERKTGGSGSRGTSPKVDRKASTPLAKTAMKKQSTRLNPDQQVYRRTATLAVGTEALNEPPIERDAETFLILIGACRALLQAENLLMRKIIENEGKEQKLLRIMITKPLHYALDMADAMIVQARKGVMKQDHRITMSLYPVSQHLHENSLNIEILAKMGSPDLLAKLKEIVKSVDSLCVKNMEDFIEHVKTDQEKFVPKDCTVHQITSNTLVFLEQLMDYRDCLEIILTADTSDKAKSAVPTLFARILSGLGLNLQNKVASYTDPYQKALFMLNNYNHILKSLLKTGILKIVCEQNQKVESYYQEQVKTYRHQYLQCWSRLVGALSEFQQSKAALPTPIPDREREQLKAAFATFNREFETVNHSQKDLSVPDPELAAQIRKESKDLVLQKYQTFFQSYAGCGFTKNPDKYVKYTPENVSMLIERLFDAAHV